VSEDKIWQSMWGKAHGKGLMLSKRLDRISLIGICDPHFTAYNPSSWKVSYYDELEKTIKSLFHYANTELVDGIVWAGDIFHLKSPSRNPLWFMTKIIQLMREAPCPNLGIAGNHDLKFGSLEGLEGQPLELLMEAGVYHLLDQKPWIFSVAGFEVEVAGKSYEHGRAVEPHFETNAKWKMSVGHFWFGKQTGTLFGEQIYGPDHLVKWKSDIYLIGHHHDDQGIVRRDNKQYCSVGSVTRTGSHRNDLERRPSAVLMSFTENAVDIQPIRVLHRPMSELIDMDRREQVMKEKEEIDNFIETLKEGTIGTMDPDKVLSELDLPEEVREKTREYLDKAEVKCSSE